MLIVGQLSKGKSILLVGVGSKWNRKKCRGHLLDSKEYICIDMVFKSFDLKR